MILSTFMNKVWYAYKGNSSFPPVGGEKYVYHLSLANDLLHDQWADDSDHNWPELWATRDLDDTADPDILTYDLSWTDETDLIRLSDKIVLTLGTLTKEYPVIKETQRLTYDGDAVYATGEDPQVLTFNAAIPEQFDGATISVPGYYFPEELSDPADVIPCRPLWLIKATAAEIARNDPAKDDQFGNLIGQANEQWEKMVAKAQDIPYDSPSSAEVDLPFIGMDNNGSRYR